MSNAKRPEEWLNFYYPFFFDQKDERYVPPHTISTAISVGIVKTPKCEAVSDLEYNMAVAYYAAVELSNRYAKAKGGQINLTVSSGGLLREKEGDLERQYGEAKVVTKQLEEFGTASPYDRWKEITGKCDKPGFFLRSRRI